MNERDTEVKLHPEYALEYWKLKAMFDGDPSFEIKALNDKTKECKVWCATERKMNLFDQIIVPNLRSLEVTCYTDEGDGTTCEEDVAELFASNQHFSRLYSFEKDGLLMQAVLFKPECICYFSDDMFSPNGHTAVLPQDLARELIGAADPEDGGLLVNIKTDLGG